MSGVRESPAGPARKLGELTDDDVRRTRVAAQLLHRPAYRPAVSDVVSRLLAVQAQDIAAAPLALRARTQGLTAPDVAAARDDRSVVRTWGPRGTLHFVAADDVAWLLSLVGPSWINGAMRRLNQEGITGSVRQLVEVTARALAGQGPLTKLQLGERLAKLGRRAQGQGIVHLAFLAAAHGKVLLGPDRSNKPSYVHAGDWLGRELALAADRARAVAELAGRYLRAHAPAGPEDLAAWSGLPLRDAKAGWAAIAAGLTEVKHGRRRMWRPKRGTPRPTEVALALLPAFDEYLLGWRDRTLVLGEAHTKRVQPGGGIVKPTVLADGRIVGTWGAGRPAAADRVTAELFDAVDGDALRADIEDLVRFSRPKPTEDRGGRPVTPAAPR